jgi:hypothetical protein
MDIDEYGFPQQFNFNGVKNRFMNVNGRYMYPYSNMEVWDENVILTKLLQLFNVDRIENSKLYFYGTDWNSSL